jgi:hypothetical protein
VKGIEARLMATHFARHPSDISTVTRAAWRLRRQGWWRQAPFLPLPGQAYWQFRLTTATGSPTGSASVREVIEYAKWSDLQRAKG